MGDEKHTIDSPVVQPQVSGRRQQNATEKNIENNLTITGVAA